MAKITEEIRMSLAKMDKNMKQRESANELEISSNGISEILSLFQGTRSISNRARHDRS